MAELRAEHVTTVYINKILKTSLLIWTRSHCGLSALPHSLKSPHCNKDKGRGPVMGNEVN